MAQFRTRSKALSFMLVGTVALLATQFMTPAFIQQSPKADSSSIGTVPAGALGASVALSAALPASALVGPLTGTAACVKPLLYAIYPLCDPIFWLSPVYLGPALFVFWATIITVINLLIPATQADEDLRV